MTLRFLIIFLLVLNVLAYAVVRGWLGDPEHGGEPHRIAEQLSPERIRLSAIATPEPPAAPLADAAPPEASAADEDEDSAARAPTPAQTATEEAVGDLDAPPEDTAGEAWASPEPAASAALEPSSQAAPAAGATALAELAPTPEPESPAAAAPEPAPPPEPAPAPEPPQTPAVAQSSCHAWADLSNDEANRLVQRLRRIGLSATRSRSETPDSWWVRIPAQGSRSAAERRVVELNLLGVTDTFIVQEPGPTQHAVSLGVFKTESRARVLLSQLRARGVDNAGVEPRMRTSYRIQAVVPDEQLRMVESAVRGVRARRQACTPR